jgi:hypothetical protein
MPESPLDINKIDDNFKALLKWNYEISREEELLIIDEDEEQT